MKKSLTFVVVIIMGLLMMSLCGCTDKDVRDERQKASSDAMTYEELVTYYGEIEHSSEDMAASRLHAMEIDESYQDTNTVSYRLLTLPLTENDENYVVQFIVTTDEMGESWSIQEIKFAWVEMVDETDFWFVGDIHFWIRGAKSIEYDLNGDFCKESVESFDVEHFENSSGRVKFVLESEQDVEHKQYLHFHSVEDFL